MYGFPKIKGKVLFNEPLFRHTTFHIGGPCKAWVEPYDEEELKRVLQFALSKKEKIFVIGLGSNVLFSEKGFDGILIHLASAFFKKVQLADRRLIAGAGVLLGDLINLACENGLSGLEGLIGIPGTLGGAIFMNSSYDGSVSDCLEEVKLIHKFTGQIHIKKRAHMDFRYRYSGISNDYIILEARLRLKRGDKKSLLEHKNRLWNNKKRRQPLEGLSAGCIFKNPNGRFSAARYIEMSHLKGKKIGGAKISEKHGNFIINFQRATSDDVLQLIEFAKRRVKSQFGIELTTELVIVPSG